MPRIVCVCGTRPDAIKTAPVVLELRKYSDKVETLLVSTGQHREMLDQALAPFGLTPDADLQIMSPGQTLAHVTAKAMEGLDRMLADLEPSWVVAQGDTTTTFVASLAAFYRRIPFAHIEAGLRTETIDDPFPEEFNRRATGQVSALHFAPTRWAADNLRAERVPDDRIAVTGNTGIDALKLVASQGQRKTEFPQGEIILVTTHRRENWGDPQRRIAQAVRRLLDANENRWAILPMHRNPVVRETLQSALGDHPRCLLMEPPEYGEFAHWMKAARLILTDSGGVQEEAPSFGVPVLVLRETTERPEGVHQGVASLVGTDEEAIFSRAEQLLTDSAAYDAMAKAQSPYGDGRAAARIRYLLLSRMGIDSPREDAWQ